MVGVPDNIESRGSGILLFLFSSHAATTAFLARLPLSANEN